MSYEKDVEKSSEPNYETRSDEAVGEALNYGSFWGKWQRVAGKFGVEQRGIERVPEDERTDSKRPLLNVFTMWFSCNMVVSSFAIGILAKSVFFLGFVDALLACLFFNLIGVIPVCWFSAFGPKFGLRQMVLSRYWFGWWGVKLVAFFNVIACVGWSAVNAIVGASLIHAVNNDVPPWAGIVIIAVVTLLVCIFGYKIVHVYEFWSWIPTLIVFFIVLGEFAHSGDFVNIPMGVGTSEMGSIFSFGSVVFGFAVGWSSYAADYTVYQPVTMSRKKVAFSTWLGLVIPLLFTELLGIAVMTATSIADGDNKYQKGYDNSSTGGLLAAVLFPPLGGFGKFCLVILALSIIANNCPNIYSVALSMQVLSSYTAKVPRFIWTTLATGAYIVIAITGYVHFETVLHYFMDFIGYWLAIYVGVVSSDHFFYKRGFSGYDLSIWNEKRFLPPGFAAIGAFCCGIVGVVLGMSQAYYVGAIAKHAGELPFGGDVAFELGFAFAFVTYFGLRRIELHYFHR